MNSFFNRKRKPPANSYSHSQEQDQLEQESISTHSRSSESNIPEPEDIEERSSESDRSESGEEEHQPSCSESDSESEKSNTSNSSSSTHSNVFGGSSSNKRSLSPQTTNLFPVPDSIPVARPDPRTTTKISLGLIFRYLLIKMIRFSSKYHKEISIIFFLIASALSLVKKGPVKIQTASSPRPFFPSHANKYLQDNFNGDFVDLSRKTIPFTPTFIFYYAPWDSESLEARWEFLRVANYFHNTQPGLVKFVSVNCWYLNGQCRQNFKGLSHFPIFVIHAASPSGAIYNGPIRSQLMIRFIHLALKPMTRLDSEDNFWSFRSQHDVIMLSYFNFTDPNASKAYETFRQVALRHLESDAFGQVGFGIILNHELAEKYFLSASSSASTISLIMFNEIHTAKWSNGLREKQNGTESKGPGPVTQIIQWLTERTKKLPLTWIYPMRNGFGNRPSALGPTDLPKELMKGPLFLLISKRYYPSSYSPFYNQVKEVAIDYFNCNQSGNVTKLRRTIHKLNSEWMKLWKSISQICNSARKMSYNCEVMTPQLEHWNAKKNYYKKESLANFENISNELNFTGLSCMSRRPMRFIAIDPEDVLHFTELAFGIKRQHSSQQTCDANSTCTKQEHLYNDGDPLAFIIDAQTEVLIPVTSFNISELAQGIHSFTVLRENPENAKKPSSYLVSEASKTKHDNQLVQRFNSDEFLKHLKLMNNSYPEPSKSTSTSSLLLMYTAQFCGFCNVVLTQFLSLRKFLDNYSLNITLGKIDTFKNTLPLELSPETIPSFVLYSSPRNSTNNLTGIEKRLFPSNQEITAKSLLRFLLSELDPSSRVNLSINATTQKCSTTNKSLSRSECLTRNKNSVANQIQSVLLKLGAELGILNDKESLDGYDQLDSSKTDMLQVPRPITVWETELLDHLRSVKLTLDVS